MNINKKNLTKVRALCKCNPNEVIIIDGIHFCWNTFKEDESIGIFSVDFGDGWEVINHNLTGKIKNMLRS